MLGFYSDGSSVWNRTDKRAHRSSKIKYRLEDMSCLWSMSGSLEWDCQCETIGTPTTRQARGRAYLPIDFSKDERYMCGNALALAIIAIIMHAVERIIQKTISSSHSASWIFNHTGFAENPLVLIQPTSLNVFFACSDPCKMT